MRRRAPHRATAPTAHGTWSGSTSCATAARSTCRWPKADLLARQSDEEIRRLIELSCDKGVSCDQVNTLVRTHLERVQAKRKALQALEGQLEALSAQCESGHRVADCGILEELIHAAHGEACACHPAYSPL